MKRQLICSALVAVAVLGGSINADAQDSTNRAADRITTGELQNILQHLVYQSRIREAYHMHLEGRHEAAVGHGLVDVPRVPTALRWTDREGIELPVSPIGIAEQPPHIGGDQ